MYGESQYDIRSWTSYYITYHYNITATVLGTLQSLGCLTGRRKIKKKKNNSESQFRAEIILLILFCCSLFSQNFYKEDLERKKIGATYRIVTRWMYLRMLAKVMKADNDVWHGRTHVHLRNRYLHKLFNKLL